MRYNSNIILRGITKPVFTSEANARSVRTKYEDSKVEPSYKFSIGNISFSKSDIKYIEILKDSIDGQEKDEMARNFYNEEKERYLRIRKWTPEEKAKNTSMFELVYFSSCNKNPSAEILQDVIKAQLDFFTSNPNRTICDFNLLSKFIKKDTSSVGSFHIGGLRLIEGAIFRDSQLSKKYK